jgi:hypothetical protein
VLRELSPSNALYVQSAVRHEPLPFNQVLFVQAAVRASQLESAARNARVDSVNTATPGVVSLLDPFALGAPTVQSDSANSAAENGKNAPQKTSDAPAGHDNVVTLEPADATADAADRITAVPRAAASFASQLQGVATRMRPPVAPTKRAG